MSELPINGPWIVTTEGDEEGRTMQQVGIFSGPIDRVALGLADKAFYALHVRPLVIVDAETLPISRLSVHVSNFPIGNDWDRLLKGRPVTTRKSNFYDSTEIIAGDGYIPLITASRIRSARSKLTKEEYEALRSEFASSDVS